MVRPLMVGKADRPEIGKISLEGLTASNFSGTLALVDQRPEMCGLGGWRKQAEEGTRRRTEERIGRGCSRSFRSV